MALSHNKKRDRDAARFAGWDDIDPSFFKELACPREVFEELQKRIQGTVVLKGDADYNQGLSERRADAARGYLSGAGLESDRVAARGMGESEPVDTNDTDAGRQENRRVEVAIFASEGMQREMLRRHGRVPTD